MPNGRLMVQPVIGSRQEQFPAVYRPFRFALIARARPITERGAASVDVKQPARGNASLQTRGHKVRSAGNIPMGQVSTANSLRMHLMLLNGRRDSWRQVSNLPEWKWQVKNLPP